jgi:hypothetical protein
VGFFELCSEPGGGGVELVLVLDFEVLGEVFAEDFEDDGLLEWFGEVGEVEVVLVMEGGEDFAGGGW